MCCVNARHRFRITFRKNSYVKHMTAKLACNVLLFFCFCARQDVPRSLQSVSNFNFKALARALVFYMVIIHNSQIFIQSNMFSQIKNQKRTRCARAVQLFEVEISNSNMAHMRMQSKCASYYFARQNCSACTQQYIGARGTRFNVVKSFVRKFHCSAACSPCLCKNDVVWNSEKMCLERQYREGSFNFKTRNRRQNLLLSTNHSSVHLFVLDCNGRVFVPSKFRRNENLSFEAQL